MKNEKFKFKILTVNVPKKKKDFKWILKKMTQFGDTLNIKKWTKNNCTKDI